MTRPWIPALLFALATTACASSIEPPPPAPPPQPVVEARTPPPPPQPRAVVVSQPQPMLPKTASPLPAVGLGGLGALVGAGALRWIRRRV